MLPDLHKAGPDKRRAARAPFAGKTVLRQASLAIPCVAENISESGILLRARAGIPTPRTQGIELVLALRGRAFGLRAELARVDEGDRDGRGCRWALRFLKPSPAERAALRDYVRTYRRRDSADSADSALRRSPPESTQRPPS